VEYTLLQGFIDLNQCLFISLFFAILYNHDLGSCEYVRKMLGLYAARRDEVSVGIGSLEVRAVDRQPKDPVRRRFSEFFIVVY